MTIIANQSRHSNGEYPSIWDKRLSVMAGPKREARPRVDVPGHDEKSYLFISPFHSPIRLAISAVSVSRIADGVREKRGAGAGWVTP